jgi:hypothetical protein
MARSQFVIACDGDGETLFMVDRDRQTASFWSNRLTDAFVYKFEQAAIRKAASLRYNNPRAMPLHQAVVIAEVAEREREEDQIMSTCEQGWDAHKAWIGR